MQMDEAARLRKNWNGDPCPHSNLEKEYELGSATGDYICTRCGESGYGRHWPQNIPDVERD